MEEKKWEMYGAIITDQLKSLLEGRKKGVEIRMVDPQTGKWKMVGIAKLSREGKVLRLVFKKPGEKEQQAEEFVQSEKRKLAFQEINTILNTLEEVTEKAYGLLGNVGTELRHLRENINDLL